MKSVAMFNNKGGVGKTTLLCNLAAYLSIQMGVRVLLVDCDPQCNTTQLVMGEEFASSFYWNDHHEPATTIADLMRPIQEGDSQISDQFAPIYRDRNRFQCDVIAGHPDFSFLEDRLSLAWSEVSAGQIGGYRKTNWARLLCSKVAEHYDLILFDVGPSLGAINRSVLLGCDYFVTPMGSDIFSILGVRNIQRWLSDAIATYEHGVRRCDELTAGALDRYDIPRVPSIRSGFVGYTLNQYLTKSKGGERIATDRYEEILRKVPQEIAQLQANFGAPTLNGGDAKLGDVPHMYSLIPLAQTRAAPIGELASRDGIVGSHYKMIENYEGRMQEIATNFIVNTGLE
ncbi:ParA family protein [Hydrogenophaga sp. SNF1]|uniref:ParA family protein n=1 Tax=Hydrogenophaga sp. SNF1 TaxID=3098762 RepID=UPI002ACBDCC5|nr:ParA family protein [Hydrogenophaga sp. SNF1]WQB85837.1 ParA family protein [Hydrogenophaga sp. SNF1]